MGSIFGGGSNTPSGQTTTTQNNDPWAGIQDYLKQAAGDTKKLYESGSLKQTYYPGSTVVPFSPETQAALGLTANRALAGSPVNNAANSELMKTLQGDYLSPTTNPGFKQGLQDITDAYSKGTAAQTDAAFSKAGAYGGSAYKEMTADNSRKFSDSLMKYAGDLYGAERDNQMKSMFFAPQQANQDYVDFGKLADVGAAREGMASNQLQEQIDRYNFNQQAPAANIQSYIDLLNGAGGKYGTATVSKPYYTNDTAQTIGNIGNAAMTAFQVASLFSDARLKHDIKHTGYENGFPVYSFRYLPEFDPQQHEYRGVMAQDVILTRPDAVIYADNGYMAVNYDKIGIEFGRIN